VFDKDWALLSFTALVEKIHVPSMAEPFRRDVYKKAQALFDSACSPNSDRRGKDEAAVASNKG